MIDNYRKIVYSSVVGVEFSFWALVESMDVLVFSKTAMQQESDSWQVFVHVCGKIVAIQCGEGEMVI
jgi:hypothetical protein